ncbi:MAG: adenosylmethionine--8-amino-7-oxononanoate transaminase [Rickettsiales bacterium]|nr:adenosylmethionine--8-amino-7-oxononanoate transaminase [Rickettsiales bacterium]
MKEKKQNWYDNGIKHIWLPYTQMHDFPEQLKVIKTKGAYIYLEDGRKLIDGISSWWATAHGHNHPYITKQIRKQLKKFPHIMFAGIAHQPAYELAHKLIKFVNKKENILNKVFFSDSGSTGVEVALKMAIQYHYNLGKKKTKFISFKNSYHGDTLGAMSLADPTSSMHAKFSGTMPSQLSADIPSNKEYLNKFIETLDANINEIAGLIIEPLIQCAGGMKCYDIDTLNTIMSECKKREIIIIFDECATGFYRTGKKFAFHHSKYTPDILILGKALTGGTVTLSATIATDRIFNSFLSKSLDNALMHGPTYMANPIACSAAIASLELFEKNSYEEKIKSIEEIFKQEFKILKSHIKVKDIRVIGAIGVIEINKCEWKDICKMREFINKNDIWLRPFSNVIYIMPPYTISKKDLIRTIDFSKKLLDLI